MLQVCLVAAVRAEAEAQPEADPQLLYAAAYPYGYAAAPYGYAAAPIAHVAAPVAYTAAVKAVVERLAEVKTPQGWS